jgi:hypothetical protein
MIELNTMLRLKTGDIDLSLVKEGAVFNVIKSGTRIYPMNLSILLLNEAWTALGYCMITKTVSNGEQMDVTFQMLSVFTQEESEVVTRTMLEGLDGCGYQR